ncbi:RNase adaptor protein RapZ, partial [bacterium]|nr:RNase adaptor protein RapZ [bacterium]
MEFLIVTGISGAGKSQAIKCLEDMGFFCVDNLPTVLIPKFAEFCRKSGDKIIKVALGIDIREGKFLNDLFDALEKIKEMKINYKIIFLDASDEILVRRYSETRRIHPLAKNREAILSGIKKERNK